MTHISQVSRTALLLLFFLVLLLALSESGLCEGKWELVWEPDSLKPPLSEAFFLTPQLGWVLSAEGFLFRTQDGGVSWQEQTLPRLDNPSLRSLRFLNEKLGWMLAQDALLLRTKDGGETWEQIPILGSRLNSLHFVSEQQGWAVGLSGALLHTQDGGTTWQPQQSGTLRTLWSVQFLDEKHGWVAGGKEPEGGILLATDDGGKTWEPQISQGFPIFLSVFFKNPQQGWVTGFFGTLLSTRDGGKGWKKQDVGVVNHLGRIQFLNDQEGFIEMGLPQPVGNAMVLHTVDGGARWELLGLGQIAPNVQWVSFVFLSPKEGWAVGAIEQDRKKGALLAKTGDGGKSWDVIWGKLSEVPVTGVQRIQFLNPLEGFAVGRDILLHTTDGGFTWQKQEMKIRGAEVKAFVFYDLFFTSPTHGFLVGGLFDGFKGVILMTADGGRTWEQQESGVNWWLARVFFISPQDGWAVGQGGILHTQNGGKTWEVQEQRFFLFSVDFVDAKTGWVGGQLGVLLYTQDGGKTWEERNPGVDYRFEGLDFLSKTEGWAVGLTTFPNVNWAVPGVVLHTTDGGKTWQRIADFDQVWSRAVLFVNPKEGWVGGIKDQEQESGIYHTRDGGATWKLQQEIGGARGVSDFAYDGAHTVWAVAWGIWKYTDSSLQAYAVEPGSDKAFTTWGKLKTAVYQNYPNPFNPETWMPYQLAQDSDVTIRIYNVQGHLVRELSLGKKPAGVYFSKDKAARWDGTDSTGNPVASGTYFYTLHAGEYQATRKLVVVK